MLKPSALALATPLLIAALAACQSMGPPPGSTTVTTTAAAGPQPTGAPIWQQGRDAGQASSTLAPIAGKLTVTPASEIPLANYKLPPGFKAEIWSTGTPGVRAMVR